MSFQPFRVSQFVRVPPEVRRLQGHASRLVPAGVLGVAAGVLAAIVFVKQWDDLDGYQQISAGIAVAGAVVGGVLALARQAVGAPLAAGGVCLFIALAATLVGVEITAGGAFDSTEAKLMLAAGIVGLIAAVVALAGLGGSGNAAVGAVVAVLAFVAPVSIAVLLKVDDDQLAANIAPVVGAVIVAVVIAVGAVRGTFGALASIVGAGATVPTWIDTAKELTEREAAGIAALVAAGAIVVLGGLIVVLNARAVDDGVRGGRYDANGAGSSMPVAMVDPSEPPEGAMGASIATVATPTAVAARMTSTTPVVGAPLNPVSAPSVPVATSARPLGRWAPDPYGRYEFRYWNGTRWTDNVANNGVTALDPVQT